MSTTCKSIGQKTNHLIIFTRYPEPGKTKTRLIAALGPDGAAQLQRQLTEHTLEQVRQAQASLPLSIEIRYAGGSNTLMQEWLGLGLCYRAQGEGDLGERMNLAFQEAFRAGKQQVVIIGTDCPGLDVNTIEKAFAGLQDHDLILGPAKDGGYYLIGLTKNTPQLFAGISWGTDQVFAKTSQIAKNFGLQINFLDPLQDIDYAKDLPAWKQITKPKNKNFSVIIPTLNEENNISKTLASIPFHSDIEVIVADAGSNDNTVEIARSHGATTLSHVPGGRANQMNTGALLAKGQILLFLHADTQLPPDFETELVQILSHPGTVAGAFSLSIKGSTPSLRLVEKMTNLRSRFLQMPYGDQAIFLKTELFHKIGGFPDIPFMEDFQFLQKLRKQGKVVTTPLSVLTSTRRWQTLGLWKTTAINQLIILAYYLGIAPSRLATWYRKSSDPLQNKKSTTLVPQPLPYEEEVNNG